MYGKGEGGKVSGEFAVMHPDVVTAAISYSWGWWSMPSELEKPIDMVNNAPEFYLVLGLRDFTHHLTTVRDTYERLRAKGYRTIYREFEELGDVGLPGGRRGERVDPVDMCPNARHAPSLEAAEINWRRV